MGSLVYLLTLAGAGAAVFIPWVGVVDGYFSVLLGPHILWWWAFSGSRHFYYIFIGLSCGTIIHLVSGKLQYNYLLNKQNFLLLMWFIFIAFSYYFGPYVGVKAPSGFFPPDYIFSIMVKAFLFYFISAFCIDSEKKFKYLSFVIIITSIYFIYWINSRYLSGHYGRLGGPVGLSSSQYGDENNFAMFFVISLPFLYYFGIYLKNKFLKYGVWLVIPFGWHAIFLTGSRGGVLGILLITSLIVYQSEAKKYGVIVLLLLIVAFAWQGGAVLKSRSSIYNDSGSVESSAQGRLNSWSAAIGMIASHPITGVGVSSFGAAYSDFSDKHPLEAHNTYFQIGAESGLPAVIFYISFLIYTIFNLHKINHNAHVENTSFTLLMSKALFLSWIGFAFCALFLSLQVFEQFFYLAVLSNFVISDYRQIQVDCGD